MQQKIFFTFNLQFDFIFLVGNLKFLLTCSLAAKKEVFKKK